LKKGKKKSGFFSGCKGRVTLKEGKEDVLPKRGEGGGPSLFEKGVP